jgi:uncharacterized protein
LERCAHIAKVTGSSPVASTSLRRYMEKLEEQIKLLVELQELDTHILKLDATLESIPEAIKRMEDDFKQESNTMKALEDGVKALQLKRKEREGDLEAKEVNIKKYQTQMYQAKTNKEYTAFQGEIDRIKADNSIIEEDILKIFDAIDVENKKIVKEKEVLKEKEAALGSEKKKLSDEADRVKKELEILIAQRKGLTAKVEKTVLLKYERVLKSKDGLAVVPVVNDSCQGCFRVMPPQVINEIKMNKDLIFCDNCTRILYVED